MSEKQKTAEEIRQELIKIHCENQDCDGCPKEYECEEEGLQQEARDEDAAYEAYDGDSFDY
jgi:hypothetical protein